MPDEYKYKADIRELAYRYAQAVDQRDFAALETLFVPDAKMRGPQFEMIGRDAIVSGMAQVKHFKSTQHFVSNQLVELKGDMASAQTYCLAVHIIDDKGELSKMDWGIRYQDELHRCDGHWQFVSRLLQLEWSQTTKIQE